MWEEIVNKYRNSKPRLTFSLFFALSALAGIISMIGFLNLPPSEVRNTIIANFSLRRILTLLIYVLGITTFLIFLLKSCLSSSWAILLEQKIHSWHQRHPVLSAADFCLSAGLMLVLIGMDFLMNPLQFPRMAYYMFLYVRLRPILFWLFVVVLLSFSLSLIHHWWKISVRDFLPQNRSSRLGIGGLILTLLINLVLWLNVFLNPDSVTETNPGMIILDCLSFLLLFISLFMIDHSRRSGS
jgi:hypothetical protein